MGTCIKTQLKENVNNPNLEFLNSVTLTFNSVMSGEKSNTNRLVLTYISGSTGDIKSTGTLEFNDGNSWKTEVNDVAYCDLYFRGQGKLIISNKDVVSTLNLYNTIIEYPFGLKFLSEINNFRNQNNQNINYSVFKDIIYTCPKLNSLQINQSSTFEISSEDAQQISDSLINMLSASYISLPAGYDVASINIDYLECSSTNILSWGERTGTSITLYRVNLNNDVDKMLINQASLTPNSSGDLTISVLGTRTSASDAAVATLKAAGYTIIINGETL